MFIEALNNREVEVLHSFNEFLDDWCEDIILERGGYTVLVYKRYIHRKDVGLLIGLQIRDCWVVESDDYQMDLNVSQRPKNGVPNTKLIEYL